MSSEDAQAAAVDETTENEENVTENQQSDYSFLKDKEAKSDDSDSDNNSDNHSSSTLPDDPEILKREIAKLRRENAAKRTKNREVEEAAKKWQEYVDSQKTEMEKLQDQLSALREENLRFKLEREQNRLAREYGVDPDLVEFIVGADLDEMEEKAKKLAAKSAQNKKPSTTANDLRAGRGNAAKPTSGASWLRELFEQG